MRYSEIFKEAERLHALGLAVHWLHPKSKRPIESGWTSGPRKEWNYLAETYTAGLNLGVRLGSASPIAGGYLAVIDIDVKSPDKRHRIEAHECANALMGFLAYPAVASGRGHGSGHFYCVTKEPFKTFNPGASEEIVRFQSPSKKPSKNEIKELTEEELAQGLRLSKAWEVSLYSEGRQVVLPPSVHPDSGELYRWVRRLVGVGDLPMLSIPSSVKTEKVQEKSYEIRKSTDDSIGNFPGLSESSVDISWLEISDDVRAGIETGKGVQDRSSYLLKAASALLSAGLTEREVLTVLTDPDRFLGACAYEHAQTKDRTRAAQWVWRYTLSKVATEKNPETVFGPPSPPPRKLSPEEAEAQAEEFEEERSWRQDLDRTEKGKVRDSLKNIDLIFSNDVGENLFIEDLFASRIGYGIDTPWGGKAKEPIKDLDMILIKRWMSDAEGIEPATGALLDATSLVAHRCRVHPVREYLGSLKWDGVPRIDTWIRDFCEGKAQEPYLSEISRKFLLAMVKRVFEPGCQWDYVLVLEGKQGRYKSSAARALAGDKWFMDNLPDLKDKDSMLNLQGKWLIELGELADVKRADYNLVKAYLVRRTDTVRPHYGKLMSDVPRQSVFIGTINEGQYLKDPTGNRRYWPVRVGTCDAGGLGRARDQLFAEAMHVYRETGEVLMLSELAGHQATAAQNDRRVDDDNSEMLEAIEVFMASEEGKRFNWDHFKMVELMSPNQGPWGRWANEKYAQNTGALILRNLGFDRKKIEGQRIWFLAVENDESPVGTRGLPEHAPGQPSAKTENEVDFL